MHVQRLVCDYRMTNDLLAVEFEPQHFSLAEIQPHLGTAYDNSLYDCSPPTPDQEAILRKTNALPDLDREKL